MEFKIGQNFSRKKSSVVWTLDEISETEVKLSKKIAKDKVSNRTVAMKLFKARWVFVAKK